MADTRLEGEILTEMGWRKIRAALALLNEGVLLVEEGKARVVGRIMAEPEPVVTCKCGHEKDPATLHPRCPKCGRGCWQDDHGKDVLP